MKAETDPIAIPAMAPPERETEPPVGERAGAEGGGGETVEEAVGEGVGVGARMSADPESTLMNSSGELKPRSLLKPLACMASTREPSLSLEVSRELR